ncbi:hypothetical protein [Actinomyces oris]|uniref:hypothetical protein n=1 Tax=Actinomyces oris TaxID=544580 RepID=UPI0028E513BD|nr:hypothetical protein [Actinomyces oris]
MTIASLVLIALCSRLSDGTREGGTTHKVKETSAVSVVPTVAPSEAADYVCAGIPSSSLKAMFGDGVKIVAASPDITNAVCLVSVNGHGVFTSKFRYVSGEYDGWASSYAIPGDVTSTFSFDGVDGKGEAKVDEGSNPEVGTTVYTCGDKQLILAASDGSAMRGDMKANLVDLTHSTLPWLCGSAPIPGLGKTMEEYRPQFLKTPSPSADGAADIS